MIIKNPILTHNDINPFAKCVLNRKIYADNLTKIIEASNQNLVIALNNKWGTGKTTFIEMWKRMLAGEHYNYKTIYFNAWENDFEDEPMTAILGELTLLSKNGEDKFKKVLKAASNFAVDFLPAVAKGVATNYVGKDTLDLIESASKGGISVINKLIENYSDKKRSLKHFREELEKTIYEISPDKPIVFFIDELDRCRPNYSVAVLEKIKHFFNVKNIVFILAIDKEQLGYAVSGVYNSANIDANNYLKKFFDLEYSLPLPDNSLYIDYLFKYYKIEDYLGDLSHNTMYDLTNLKDFYNKLLQNSSLRDLEKICSSTALSLILFKNHHIEKIYLAFLLFLKIFKTEMYLHLQNKNYSIQDLVNEFDKMREFLKVRNLDDYLIIIEAYILMTYSNYLGEGMFKDYIYNGKESLLSRLDLTNFYQDYKLQGLSTRVSLKYYLDKIEISTNIETN